MAKLKQVLVTFSNGETWAIDPIPLMRERAEYYANSDLKSGVITEDQLQQTILAELEYAMGDEHEIIDYIKNNVDWNECTAVLVDKPSTFDYGSEFTNAEMKVVELSIQEPSED